MVDQTADAAVTKANVGVAKRTAPWPLTKSTSPPAVENQDTSRLFADCGAFDGVVARRLVNRAIW
jgi:hypothetical protein